ncbi:HupE/UreJ family protein [Photobacterium halotolerans]|uniref:Urease accessory protein UreJ n=1 Tax=Photobacterium halotolerans TaxID=265726 RepID=A0A7X4Y2X5_9GAMM|nr:HupE/UreJ family protein [Photobacterium halotolerans]NAW64135.1 urease accessory protein UreJ [Photobacterium halotolerans]NAW88842.1 urease accessory protein UreJ [Photobacterium halotolerans]NAX49126.1 urease accessory protein UreJ [Photobacterium halotolerans]
MHQGSTKQRIAFIGTGILLSAPAFAHVGHGQEAGTIINSFMAGVTHPLTGLDHLAMLLGVGFLSAQTPGLKKQMSLMVSALASILLGLAFGAMTGGFSGMETLILGSVFVAAAALGFKAFGRSHLATVGSMLSVAMLLAHGWAHGVEAPASALLTFAPGMLVSATGILIAGNFIGRAVPARWLSPVLAFSGVMLALAS